MKIDLIISEKTLALLNRHRLAAGLRKLKCPLALVRWSLKVFSSSAKK